MLPPGVVQDSIPAHVNKANCEKNPINYGNIEHSKSLGHAGSDFREGRRTILQHLKITVHGEMDPVAQAHLVSPISAVLMFALYHSKRHYQPPHSVQLVISPTSQTAFVGAAESKAGTICLINDL